MRVNDFGPHTDSIFKGRLIRECDLYASIYGTVLVETLKPALSKVSLAYAVCVVVGNTSIHCLSSSCCWWSAVMYDDREVFHQLTGCCDWQPICSVRAYSYSYSCSNCCYAMFSLAQFNLFNSSQRKSQ